MSVFSGSKTLHITLRMLLVLSLFTSFALSVSAQEENENTSPFGFVQTFLDYLEVATAPTSIPVYGQAAFCQQSEQTVISTPDGGIRAYGFEVTPEQLSVEFNPDEHVLLATSPDELVNVYRLFDGVMYQVNYGPVDGIVSVIIFNWPTMTWLECTSFSVEG